MCTGFVSIKNFLLRRNVSCTNQIEIGVYCDGVSYGLQILTSSFVLVAALPGAVSYAFKGNLNQG